MPSSRRLIVTHRSPDLDAIASVWFLKRFDNQHYGTAKVAFVDAGETLSENKINELGFDPDQVIHVDTGKGDFDHHQPERGQKYICATSLVYDHICKIHPEKKDDQVLQTIVNFVTEIDHFKEIYWPEPNNLRYSFMIENLITGMEFTNLHNDDSLLHFGFQCLDSVYAFLSQEITAQRIIKERGQVVQVAKLNCLVIETDSGAVAKRAQKEGYALVVRRDPTKGYIRIKARPDNSIDLTALYKKIIQVDSQGTWFNHPSGKMLLNGSTRNTKHKPTMLTLNEIIKLIKETYDSQ